MRPCRFPQQGHRCRRCTAQLRCRRPAPSVRNGQTGSGKLSSVYATRSSSRTRSEGPEEPALQECPPVAEDLVPTQRDERVCSQPRCHEASHAPPGWVGASPTILLSITTISSSAEADPRRRGVAPNRSTRSTRSTSERSRATVRQKEDADQLRSTVEATPVPGVRQLDDHAGLHVEPPAPASGAEGGYSQASKEGVARQRDRPQDDRRRPRQLILMMSPGGRTACRRSDVGSRRTRREAITAPPRRELEAPEALEPPR